MKISFVQTWIVLTGVAAITLVNLGYSVGSVIGLVGQPAWLSETRKAKQKGMFLLSVIYTVVWLIGSLRYMEIIR